MKTRRIGYVVSNQFIIDIMKGIKPNTSFYNKIPDDAVFHSAYFDYLRSAFIIFLEHESFPETAEGEMFPIYNEVD